MHIDDPRRVPILQRVFYAYVGHSYEAAKRAHEKEERIVKGSPKRRERKRQEEESRRPPTAEARS